MTTAGDTIDVPRPVPRKHRSRRTKTIMWVVGVVVLLGVLALGTKFVSTNAAIAAGPVKFDPTRFGADNFAKVQDDISKRAVPAATLAKALSANESAAVKKYGVMPDGAAFPEISVSFSGVLGKPVNGSYPVTIQGVPKLLIVRVQMGPAINGTDLRDATGKFPFGMFTNQIDFQNAASALNNELKQQILSKLDTKSLQGKTITGVGAFSYGEFGPTLWVITPAKLTVK